MDMIYFQMGGDTTTKASGVNGDNNFAQQGHFFGDLA